MPTSPRSLDTVRAAVAMFVAAMLVVMLSACTQAVRPAHVEVIVAGLRANSTAIPTREVIDAIASITENGDRVVVISADGDPRVILDLTLQNVPTNTDDRADFVQQLKARVGQAVAAARAVQPQSDMVAALGLAGRAFGAGKTVKRLDVFDSMVSTAGLFSMLQDGLYADPKDRVAAVEDQKELPALNGVTVHAPLFGVVTAPQEQLDSFAYASLRAQWLALFTAAKAKVSLRPSSMAPAAQPGTTLPQVTPVSVRRPVAAAVAGCAQSLPDNVLGFEGDKAVLIDPAGAVKAVHGIAVALRDCPGAIRVDGYTSSVGTQAVDLPLSRARASVVAGLLASALQIDVHSIAITGYGNGGPCRVHDRDAQGRLVEARAASNRKTIVARQTTATSTTKCP